MPEDILDKNLLSTTEARKILKISTTTLKRIQEEADIEIPRDKNNYRVFNRETILKFQKAIQKRADAKSGQNETRHLEKTKIHGKYRKLISRPTKGLKNNIAITATTKKENGLKSPKISNNSILKTLPFPAITIAVTSVFLLALVTLGISSNWKNTTLPYQVYPQGQAQKETKVNLITQIVNRVAPNSRIAQHRSNVAEYKDAVDEGSTKQFLGMVLGKRVTKPEFELEINVPTTIKKDLTIEGGITANTLSVLGGGIETQNQDIDSGTGTISAGNLTLTSPGGLNNLLIIDDTTKETLQESLEIAGDVEGALTDVEVVKLGGADVGDITSGTLLVLDGDEIVGGDITDLDTTEITELGTIETGEWEATPITTSYGGTNLSTYTTGDMVYASASNTLKQLNIGTEGYILTSTGGIPAWSEINSALGGNVFLNTGNTFGATAILGTNDAYGIVLETNDTARIFINSAGSIGIGNTSPGTKVHLGDNSQSPSYVSGESESMYIEGNLEVTGTVYGGAIIGPTGYNEGSVTFIGSTGYIDQNNSEFFWNDTTERLGIGTTFPDYKLDVVGTVGIDGDMTFVGDQTIAGTGTLTINPTGNLYFQSASYFINEAGELTVAKVVTPEIEYSGNITLDANSDVGTTTVTVTNEDGTQIANLEVEGDVNITGGKLTLASGEIIDAETSNTLAFQSDGNVTVALGDNTGTAEFVIYDTGNITVTGTVDGRDIAADGSNLDTLYTTIGLSALTAEEVNQLENIGTTTVSDTQWGYLGALDQGLTQASGPTFATLNTGQGAYELYAMNQDVSLEVYQ